MFYLLCLKAREPTNEAGAETKLVWAMPCKEEEDRRSKSRNFRNLLSHADIAEIRRNIYLTSKNTKDPKGFSFKGWGLTA